MAHVDPGAEPDLFQFGLVDGGVGVERAVHALVVHELVPTGRHGARAGDGNHGGAVVQLKVLRWGWNACCPVRRLVE